MDRPCAVLSTAELAYLREIKAMDEVQVVRTITGLGTTSMTVTSEFRVGERPAATTKHVYVLVDTRRGVSVPFEPGERARTEAALHRPL